MSLALALDVCFQDHLTGPGHVESPERLAAIDAEIDRLKIIYQRVPLRPATHKELCLVHEDRYLRFLESIIGRSYRFDADTIISNNTVSVSRLAAGAAIDLVEKVIRAESKTAMGLVRPPGHHAVPERAMGFCVLGNVAVAVKSALEKKLVERVVIYDWDVHHGNGTQAMFYDDPRVLFLSTHQSPLYPYTGTQHEIGEGKAKGTTMNVPLPRGVDDAGILQVTDKIFAPKVRNFSPDLIVISAGYDGHIDDPLGGFCVSTDGFRQLALRWRELAEEVCHGRIVGMLEGGYNLDALAKSVGVTLRAWS